MAFSKCPSPNCNSHSFENAIITPAGSNFKLTAVQCASCGAVVGILDFYNIGAELQDIKAAIKRIASAQGVSVKL